MFRFAPKPIPDTLPDFPADIPGWLASLLALRGVDSVEKARRFLHPSLDQLHDPFLMQGMDKAVALIQNAVIGGEKIVVFGDYDVDGVSATSMMLLALGGMGASVASYIPSRHEEGYGLNGEAVRKLAKEYSLMLTVDCGITAAVEVALAKELGMAVIVTDHHQLGPEVPPADAVLNPLMGAYPFRRLCGAGVAFKLLHALMGLEGAQEYFDLAALATIADLVPLTGENRVIAALGLERMASTKRVGLRALMQAAGIGNEKKAVKAGQVAFGLAPRLNAGGRLKSASLGVELLTTEDAGKAGELAEILNGENALRQKLEAEIFAQALAQVEAETDFLTQRALVVVGEGWNSGVIGLAASRLTERFHYPSIVLSQTGDECVGSARSIPGVNIHEMLSECRDLFVRFGGHEQAAGLTISALNVPEFRRRLNHAIREKCDPEVFVPVREYDMPLPLSSATEQMVQKLALLQPTGLGNPEPVFLLEDGQVQDMRPIGRDGAHLKCSLYQNGSLRSAIAFQMGSMARDMPMRADLLFSLELNEWNGTVSVQCNIKAVRTSPTAQIREDEGLQEAFLQDIRLIAANDCKIHPALAHGDESMLASALTGAQGTVILSRSPITARRIAMTYGERLQWADRINDLRSFHTLLYPARLMELSDRWERVILADGELLPGEASLISELCPRAKVMTFPRSSALSELASHLVLSDDVMRNLYVSVKKLPGASPIHLAEAAELTRIQLKAGLYILAELALIAYREEPFLVTILPSKKCSLDDSRLLAALKAAADQ